MAASASHDFGEDVSVFFADIAGIIDALIGKKENGELFTEEELKASPLFEEQKFLVLLQDTVFLLAEKSSYSSLLIFFAFIHKHKDVMDNAKLPGIKAVQEKAREMATLVNEENSRCIASLEDLISDELCESSLMDILKDHEKFGPTPNRIQNTVKILAKHCDHDKYDFLSQGIENAAHVYTVPLVKPEIAEIKKAENATKESEEEEDDIVYPPSYKKARKSTPAEDNNNEQ